VVVDFFSNFAEARIDSFAEVKEMSEQLLRGSSFGVRPSGPCQFVGSAVQRRAEAVQHFPLFSNIPNAECREIVSAAHEREFLRRQTIFLEGDPVRHIILLTSGCAKTLQCGQNGSEVILRLSGPGDLVGTISTCMPGQHCSMARTMSASTALVWDFNSFEAATERFPILRRNAVQILSKRLHEMEERYREISTEKVAGRLSHQLVRLLNQVGREVDGAVEICLSREELAQLTGTTLFTVSRLLSDWDERGIVSTRREAVSVHNMKALRELGESD
jgi:CRP/FNR family transcriptional regulator, nitrogen oxide reductase regulator